MMKEPNAASPGGGALAEDAKALVLALGATVAGEGEPGERQHDDQGEDRDEQRRGGDDDRSE
jgi:hypothetical protein